MSLIWPGKHANPTEGTTLWKAGCDSTMDWLRSVAELIRSHPVLFPALELSHPCFDTIIKMRRSSPVYHQAERNITNLLTFLPILMKISKKTKTKKKLDILGGVIY